MSKPIDVGSLKIGQYVIMEDEPCRIVEYEKSKPGKHGSAKARIVGISVFTGNKKSVISPVDSKLEVPLIEKKTGQIISVQGENIQVMDLENYQTFEVLAPSEEELKRKLASGVEVEYWHMLGRSKIMRIKG